MGQDGRALLQWPSRIPHRNWKNLFVLGSMNPWKDLKAKLERPHFFKVQSGKIIVWWEDGHTFGVLRPISITGFPHIVSVHLCTATFGLMYCYLWISKFNKKCSFHGNYMRKFVICILLPCRCHKCHILLKYFYHQKLSSYATQRIEKPSL